MPQNETVVHTCIHVMSYVGLAYMNVRVGVAVGVAATRRSM